MKVQSKITWLIVLVVAIFMCGLIGFRIFDNVKFRRIAEERLKERTTSFEAFLEKNGEPLKTFAEYDAYWDQMVQAIEKNEKKWFEENVNTQTVESYYANAAWIYNAEGKKVHDVNNINPTDLSEIPIPHEAFGQIFANSPWAHFFVRIP